MASPEAQSLAPALAALMGVPAYLADLHDLRAAVASEWTWLLSAERVAGRANAATELARFEVDLIEELGDKEIWRDPRERVGDGGTPSGTKGTTVFPTHAIVDGGRPFMVGAMRALPPYEARGTWPRYPAEDSLARIEDGSSS